MPSSKIHLKKEVMEIDWSSDDRIRVKCKDGCTYVCERCLITLPLGVLRDALGPQFNPPLPERKVKTIQVNLIFHKSRSSKLENELKTILNYMFYLLRVLQNRVFLRVRSANS